MPAPLLSVTALEIHAPAQVLLGLIRPHILYEQLYHQCR